MNGSTIRSTPSPNEARITSAQLPKMIAEQMPEAVPLVKLSGDWLELIHGWPTSVSWPSSRIMRESVEATFTVLRSLPSTLVENKKPGRAPAALALWTAATRATRCAHVGASPLVPPTTEPMPEVARMPVGWLLDPVPEMAAASNPVAIAAISGGARRTSPAR